jgi:hypothetical protein
LEPRSDNAGAVTTATMSKLLGLHFLEFVVACAAEALEQIDRAVDGHFAQLDEALVGLQISVPRFFGGPGIGYFWGKADVKWRAKSTESVESDYSGPLDVLPLPRFGRP